MSRPLDDGEEGEVHPEPRRYPSGDSWAGSDRDRERGGSRQGPSHSTSSSNGRPGFAGDNRGSRDAPRDVDWIRKELQARVAALNRQGRQVDVQSLLRLVESGSSSVEPPSTRPAPRERLWDRSDNTSSRRDRSPSRLDDRFRRGGRDLSPDRDFGRGGRPYPPAQPAAPSFRGSEIHDRIASVLSTRGDSSLRDRLVSAIGSLDSARSAAGAHPRQRQSQYDAPPPPSTSYDRWDDRPRLDRQSLRAAMSPPPPARSVPPPQLHHSTRGPSIDDWRRQQRARLSEGATANTDASPFRRLRDDFDRSRRTDTPSPPSRLAPPSATRPPSQPAYDTAARGGTYNPVSSPPRPVLHSPSSSAPRAKLLTPPLAPAFQPNAQLTPGDSALPPEEDLYDVSDEDEDGPVVSTTTPAEQSAADDHESGGEDEPVKDLASEIEELSASRLFGVLEELERTERSLAEQLRGMKHDAEDKHRQLARVRHAEEKAAKKAAAREEQARLTMEERTRIAVTASCLRSLRASQLRPADAAMPSPSPIEAAFLAAAQKNKTAGDCPVSVLWNLRPSAQQLQTVSDIIANNRKLAASSSASVGIVVLPEPVQVECPLTSLLSGDPEITPVAALPLLLPAVIPAPDKTCDAVATIIHQRRIASRNRLLALGAAYSIALDEWDAKLRRQEQLEQEKLSAGRFGRSGSSGNVRGGDALDDMEIGAAGKTRAGKKRTQWDGPGTPLPGGGPISYGTARGGSDVLRSEWEIQQLLEELEHEELRQRARDATAAELPDMFTPEMMQAAAFVSGSNNRCTTNAEPPECARMPLQQRCLGLFGCNCVVACDALLDMINPWSDVEKLIFLDKFMQFPKDFVRISKYLPNKTAQDCTAFYYLTKHVVGYKLKLRKQSISVRRRALRTGWLLARQSATAIGIHLPKALLEGSVNESGSSAVLPVAAHVPDAQFSITLVPTAPMHPPKPIVDGRKKKRGFGGRIDDKSGPSTPTKSSQPSDARNMGGQSQFRTVTASAVVKKEVAAIVRPPPVHPVKMFPNAALKPVTSSMQGRPVAGGGTPKLTPFGVKPPMGAVRPSVSAAATTTPKPVATYVPVATSAVKSNHPLVTTPSAVMPPAPLAAVRPSAPAALEAVQPPPPAAIATAAPAPASISDPDTNTIPKSFPVSKELASLIGIPLPRNSASPIPATPPADVDSVEASGDNSATAKKRKRDEDYTGSAPMAKWSLTERAEFVRLYKVHGRDWCSIASRIGTKTESQVKNFYQNNKKGLHLDDLSRPSDAAP